MQWKTSLTLFCFKWAITKTFLSDTRQPEVYFLHSWAVVFATFFWRGGGRGGGGANRLYKSKQALVASRHTKWERAYYGLTCVTWRYLSLTSFNDNLLLPGRNEQSQLFVQFLFLSFLLHNSSLDTCRHIYYHSQGCMVGKWSLAE